MSARKSFASAGDGEVVGNVEVEGGAVAVRGIVGEREPARGEQEVCAFLADDSGAEAGDGAVVLIGEQASVVEGESDFCAGGDGLRQEDGDEESVAGVALEVESFAVVGFYVFEVEILVQFDADAAGDFVGDEIDFCDGGDGLGAGVEGGGDVVVGGGEGWDREGLGRLGPKERYKKRVPEEKRHGSCGNFETNAAGHRTPFRLLAKGNDVLKPGLFTLLG